MKRKKMKVKKKLRRKVILLVIILVMLLSYYSIRINTKKDYIDNKSQIDYKYILVNKNNGLRDDYVPENLVKVEMCSQGDFFLDDEAAKAYKEMCIDSIKQELNFSIASAYRSYEEQKNLYDDYLKSYGKNYVDKYVALAGYSEHQTGLAIDLKSLETDVFENSKEYLWLKDNLYIYGFILRYQNGKEKITGYSAEAWHVRYVGKEAAKYIYDNNITYEEYYSLFIRNQ